ncbi:MAG TPA: response regulator [Burkholderiaceae bacterium]|jgi:two-component system response regulator TctD
MRILLVEDNHDLNDWLAKTLQRENYTVDCVYNGADADHLLYTQTYDLVILDLSLPKMEGREVLKRLRSRNDGVAVLILTANSSVEGRINGLDAGADDYLSKPFEVSELEARIRALMRRVSHKKNPTIECGGLIYDSNTRGFHLNGVELSLTPRERGLLEVLITKMDKVVSKQSLADSLFAINEDVSRDAIEVYVHRLRKKLETGNASIITLRGLGYMLKQQHSGT